MTKLLNVADRGGRGSCETTATLTDWEMNSFEGTSPAAKA